MAGQSGNAPTQPSHAGRKGKLRSGVKACCSLGIVSVGDGSRFGITSGGSGCQKVYGWSASCIGNCRFVLIVSDSAAGWFAALAKLSTILFVLLFAHTYASHAAACAVG